MTWADEEDLDELANAVVDAAIALRVACMFARPRGPGSRVAANATSGFDALADELVDAVLEAPSADQAARKLDRLCQVLAQTASASERLAEMPGAQRAWSELLHGRAELANAYQRAASLRWRAWCFSDRTPARLRA